MTSLSPALTQSSVTGQPSAPSASPSPLAARRPRARRAQELIDRAHGIARLRSNRAQIARWLDDLGLSEVDELLDSIAGPDSRATSRLLSDYQSGNSLAGHLLLGGKAQVLSAIARHAVADTSEAQFQLTMAAFFERALARVQPHHEFVDQQLYFVTLRTVSQRSAHSEVPIGVEFPPALTVAVTDDDHWDHDHVTASVVLAWASDRGILTDSDRQALALRFGGSKVLAVRVVAESLGVEEDMLESRLRRMTKRLRVAASAHRGDVESFGRQTCAVCSSAAAREIAVNGVAA